MGILVNVANGIPVSNENPVDSKSRGSLYMGQLHTQRRYPD